MFEKDLKQKFERIFGIDKVTYEQPSSVKEQECLWIEVEQSRNTIKDSKQTAYVRGRATVYGRNEKLPFGYFSKAIHKAKKEDTKDLFFTDFESNTKYYQDLVQRDFGFIYFYSGPYDPEQGQITEIDLIKE